MTDKRTLDEHYIPFGIYAGGIITTVSLLDLTGETKISLALL